MKTPHERLTRTTFSLPLGEVHALVGGAVNARPLLFLHGFPDHLHNFPRFFKSSRLFITCRLSPKMSMFCQSPPFCERPHRLQRNCESLCKNVLFPFLAMIDQLIFPFFRRKKDASPLRG